uniref:Uncharacterized protein n=1 Tax=Encephalitozoon cuniculi TaxID=6035 RepID=M1KB62_ENCCN|nr:hypothetical protein ECU10_1830 [Encephalitozoon cuniculi]
MIERERETVLYFQLWMANAMTERMEVTANMMKRALEKYRSTLYMAPSGLVLSFQLARNRRRCCTAEHERGRSTVMNLRKGLLLKEPFEKIMCMTIGNAIDMNTARSLGIVPPPIIELVLGVLLCCACGVHAGKGEV